MSSTKVDTLKVPGATLHRETVGSGPVLLVINGAPADSAALGGVAAFLADKYTVVTFDPRGYSRSTIDGDEIDLRVEVQADDAHHVLKAITDEPAYVLGCSGGALVGLDLVARYPEQVHTLVAHEPPAMELLPNSQDWRVFLQELIDTYHSQGAGVAAIKFITSVEHGPGAEPQGPPQFPDFSQMPPEVLETMGRMQANMEVFFGHQLKPMIGYLPDIETLKTATPKIVVAVGEASKGQSAHSAGVALAGRIGREIIDIPGDHQGFSIDPAGWAEVLHKTFQG